MNAIAVNEIVEHWGYVAPILRKPETEAEYDRLVELMNTLLDRVGSDEEHPLYDLVDLIGEMPPPST